MIWLLLSKQRRMRIKPIKVNSFVERMAKNNSVNNDDRQNVLKIFLTICFVLVITSVSKIVHSSAVAQMMAYFLKKTLPVTIPWKRFLIKVV